MLEVLQESTIIMTNKQNEHFQAQHLHSSGISAACWSGVEPIFRNETTMTPEQRKEYDRIRYQNNKETIKRRSRQWSKDNPKKVSANYEKWAKNNPKKIAEFAKKSQERQIKKFPEKVRARNLVNTHIKRGKLKMQPCEICANPKSEAHHEDYSKPLDVTWLCKKHHDKIHQTERTHQ